VVGKEESAFTHEENIHEEESAHAWWKRSGSGKLRQDPRGLDGPRKDLRGPSETYAQGSNPTALVSSNVEAFLSVLFEVGPLLVCSSAVLF
jgi:hypothetical protein